MKGQMNNNILRVLGAGVLAAGLAAPAWGQTAAGGFDKPLSTKPKSESKNITGRSTTVMQQIDGDDRYELRIDGDKLTAKVNGKEVPADRVVREDNLVKLLDEDGNVIQRFELPVVGKSVTVSPRRFNRVAPQPPEPPQAPMQMMENPPKVMLGINMAQPGEALAKNFGVEPGEAILIDRVLDGLPADRAGLREGDLITEIEGEGPATPERLRDVLKDKEPGDTVVFTVMRKGGNKAIRVKLDDFDAEKLGPLVAPKAEVWGGEEQPDVNRLQRDAERMLREHWPQGGGQWRALGQDGNNFYFRGQPMELFVQPEMQKKMAELDKRMAELDEKLSRLGDQMSKLESMMDRLAKQKQE